MFLNTGKLCNFGTFRASLEGTIQQFLSIHRTVLQRNVMPCLGQAWRVKSTNFSTHRNVFVEKFCHFYGKPAGSNQQFLSTHRTVVQRNDMPHLWQAWKVKSTNFSVHRIILQRNFMSSLKGQINKFLDTKEYFVEKFGHFYTSMKGQINKFLCIQESPAEKCYVTFRASLKGQINK